MLLPLLEQGEVAAELATSSLSQGTFLIAERRLHKLVALGELGMGLMRRMAGRAQRA